MPPTQPPSDLALLALDVDGVLTDGSIYISDDGQETKRFHVRDGFALNVCRKLGFKVAIITGRSGQALRHRAAELGIEHVIQGASDKGAALDALAKTTGVKPARMAYVGDDWPDLPVMKRVGYPMAVADADPRIRALAAFVTTRPGGHGAVREAVEHLLTRLGRIDEALRLYDT